MATLIERHLAELLHRQEADRIEALWQRMWWGLHYGGRGEPVSSAITAVDVALWDLRAMKRGDPLWRLLGGHDPKVQA